MHRLEAKLFRDLGKTQRCIADHSLCRIYLHGDKVSDRSAAALLSEKLLQFRHAYGAAMGDLRQRQIF